MNPWTVEFWRLALILLAAGALGLAFGGVGWWLVLGLSGYLVWHYSQLHRLWRWLQSNRRQQLPDAAGMWGEVYYALERLQRSERKRKQRLAGMLSRFSESTAAMPDAVVVLGVHGEIEWFNEAAQRLFGLRPRQDVGRRITHLIRHPAFTEYVAAGKYKETLEFPSPVNEETQLSIHIVPYGNDQRLLMARNVTRLHRLEVVRRDFVANVSHELRTPLTVISGYLEELEDCGNDDPTQFKSVVRTLQDQAVRMERIVEDLLTLSRLELSDAAGEDQAPVAVPELLQEIQAETAVLTREKEHDLQSDVEEALWLHGNVKELRSAFSNLVSNAVRYTPEGGVIQLRWYGDDAGAHFVVQDNGIGIEPQHLSRLTERFYRVDKNRSRASGGTGLGLAIVKHVLQRHDAKLQIESEPGKGSIFSCDFPRARSVFRTVSKDAAGA